SSSVNAMANGTPGRCKLTRPTSLPVFLSQTRMNASAPAVIKKRWSELKDILLTVVSTWKFSIGAGPLGHRQMLIFDFCSFVLADGSEDSSCEVAIQCPSALNAILKGRA